MGDRGNIVLRFTEKGQAKDIYLYTHWGGSEIGERLKSALEAGEDRWDDGPYLGRVIFQALVGDDDGVTGFGISPFVCDNEHDFLVVDMDGGKTVTKEHRTNRSVIQKWTFDEFVKLAAPVEE